MIFSCLSNNFSTTLYHLIGLTLLTSLSGIYALYMVQLHETTLWFSNIDEVEREISFRTESGFYYYFYKLVVQTDTGLADALETIKQDNRTEAPNTINALQRFNIIQEVILGSIYKAFFSETLEPIFFYAYSCFFLSGTIVFLSSLIVREMTASYSCSVLLPVWMIVLYFDSSRVFYTVNLRENFAMPFFWLQNLLTLKLMNDPETPLSNYLLTALSVFLFSMFWQFNQFILLLQQAALLLLCLVDESVNISLVTVSSLMGYLLAAYVMFSPTMMLNSYYVALALGSILLSVSPLKRKTCSKKLFFVGITVLSIKLIMNLCLPTEADSHIWEFIKRKMALDDRGIKPSFDVLLYLCHESFQSMQMEFWWRSLSVGILPFAIYQLMSVILTITEKVVLSRNTTVVQNLQPQQTFFVIQTALFAAMAVAVARMKFILFPALCVTSCLGLKSIMDRTRYRRLIQVGIIIASLLLLGNHYAQVYEPQMTDKKEFYDPDTVELMKFINSSSHMDSIWAGSMQLMSAIKLSTNRKIANHPHFENKALREKTKHIYKIYGRFSPNEVHTMLRFYEIDYFVIENSICYSPSDACSIVGIVDQSGISVSDKGNHPRICDALAAGRHRKLFVEIFSNRTFRIYLVSK